MDTRDIAEIASQDSHHAETQMTDIITQCLYGPHYLTVAQNNS